MEVLPPPMLELLIACVAGTSGYNRVQAAALHGRSAPSNAGGNERSSVVVFFFCSGRGLVVAREIESNWSIEGGGASEPPLSIVEALKGTCKRPMNVQAGESSG